MIQHEICASCNGCCSYEDYCGYEFTGEELQRYFSFTKHLSETFFVRHPQNGKFIVGKFCQHYQEKRCSIYKSETFPFACAAYPFFLIIKSANVRPSLNVLQLAIDRNCPHWESFLNQANAATALIETYLNKGLPVDVFPLKEMKQMGYRLTLLDTPLPSHLLRL